MVAVKSFDLSSKIIAKKRATSVCKWSGVYPEHSSNKLEKETSFVVLKAFEGSLYPRI